MSNTVIKVEHLSKHYNLGTIGSGTLYRDVQSWWARLRGKEDPNSQIGSWNPAQTDKCNSFWALKDVSFEVHQGDVVGIIGRNGAGKSTLLKILSKVTGPTSGSIKINGRVASLLEVGTGFHPELTGRENIYLNGTILGMRKAEIDEKFNEIVTFAEIEQFIDTPVKRYSSGMYVRLAFAVAAHLDPEILIVDEVLAVGDAKFQKKCMQKMHDVSGAGKTVLFVSHNMGAIRSLCSRACLLHHGTLALDGTVEEVVSTYFDIAFQMPDNRDLSARQDRIGGALLRLLSFDTVDADGNITKQIECGKKAFLEMRFNVHSSRIGNLRFGISVREKNTGKYITELNSYYRSDNVLSCECGVHKMVFVIPKVCLAPGQYAISFIATSGLEVLDWLKDACQLVVTDGLFYESGQMPLPGSYPMVFTDFDYYLSKDDNNAR